jgi:hypothetical protein
VETSREFYLFSCALLRIAAIALLATIGFDSPKALAQSAANESSLTVATEVSPQAPLIPQQIAYSGMLERRAGDTVEAVFRIYPGPEGGEPVWSETQTVAIGADGRFSVLLGAASKAGLPQTVFGDGQARWLGISIERAEELPRTLLASVPYAMKSADAATLAGRQAADFVTQAQLSATARALAAQATALAMPEAAPTGGGTADYLPLWTSSSALGDSILFQAGTTKIGIATKTPATTLDVNGPSTMRGTVGLPPTALATPSAAFSSPLLELSASVLRDGSVTAQNFGWKAVPSSNNTATASASLELLFSAGTGAPAATGLAISPKGIVSFAKGQAFSGTGTITGVTAGTALTGGGTTGAITLKVDTTKVPLLASANTFAGSNTFSRPVAFAPSQTFPGTGPGTITGLTAGTALTGGGTTGAVTLNVDTTKVPLLASVNTFTGYNFFPEGLSVGTHDLQGVVGVTGSSFVGVLGVSSAATFPTGFSQTGVMGVGATGVLGSGACCSGGFYDNYGVWGGGQMGVFGNSYAPDSSAVGWGVSGAVSHDYGSIYSDEGTIVAGASSAGVWGDFLGLGAGTGVLATADNDTALIAANNSGSPAMAVYNYTSATHDPVFETYSPGAYGPNSVSPDSAARYCGIDTSANLMCSGAIEQETNPDVVGRVHAMYAMQSTEVWFEDFGSGALANGSAHISLEPAFGGAVNSGVEYHVFLTPKGDCEGLYVANEGAEGFDVRELRHGKSSVAFDYRIVAKRKGYETVRMEDQTAQFEARNARMADLARRRAEVAARPQALPKSRSQRQIPGVPPASTPQRLTPREKPASPDNRAASETP